MQGRKWNQGVIQCIKAHKRCLAEHSAAKSCQRSEEDKSLEKSHEQDSKDFINDFRETPERAQASCSGGNLHSRGR